MITRKNVWYLLLVIIVISCNKKEENIIEEPIATPPFHGTIFLDPDIITDSDYSTFVSLSYAGQDTRRMYDRRIADWVSLTPFLFNSEFDDGLTIEIQVNPEFLNPDGAELVAIKFATAVGRLPTVLRKDVETLSIHKGNESFGGGNNNILIHTGRAGIHENKGILEEVLIHEASHTSLDADHSTSSGWILAQQKDGNFISTYAKDHPTTEDIAASFLVYFAVRYRSERISESLKNKILETIPNRIAYFDDQNFNMYPIQN